jgi:hypothetical protein
MAYLPKDADVVRRNFRAQQVLTRASIARGASWPTPALKRGPTALKHDSVNMLGSQWRARRDRFVMTGIKIEDVEHCAKAAVPGETGRRSWFIGRRGRPQGPAPQVPGGPRRRASSP